jgi:hypothetical protein
VRSDQNDRDRSQANIIAQRQQNVGSGPQEDQPSAEGAVGES